MTRSLLAGGGRLVVQVLKDEVKRAIAEAALEVFATEGFGRATMADIARRAGVSTGNMYRYFENKDALLAAVLPAEVPRRLTRLLRQRMESFNSGRRTSAADAHALASEELLAFTIEHRKQVVFLLARAAESPYEKFADRTIDALVELAGERFSELRPGSSAQRMSTRQLVLRQIYENLVVSTARILERFSDPAQIRAAVADYGAFHLGGLVALLNESE